MGGILTLIIWGSVRVDSGDDQVTQFIRDSDLVLLNNGGRTRVDDITGTFTVLDLSLVSPMIAGKWQWHTIVDSLGSYHLSIVVQFS